ncbi:MAG: BMP family ABC transporter substrate-binding protein [Pseudomonadota bacterium]
MTFSLAHAESIRPAIVYSSGGKFDKSFNEAAYRGAEAFQKKTGIAYRDFAIKDDSQSEQAIRNFARRGFDPVIAIGFNHANALAKVAPEFPDLRFAIVDMVVDAPNVRSIVFKEHEGTYLVGLLAGLASKTGTIGFVGGMDIPLIRRVACGYAQGAKAADTSTTVLQNMTGTTGAAWTDPVRGAELTRSQIDRGADVVFHGAGTTGLGVLQAAADAGILGIGVDSNQNGLHPGSVLTSMLKRVDVAVEAALQSAKDGAWQSGVAVLGLAEGGLGWALDNNNAELVTTEMRQAVAAAEEAIIDGSLAVHDFTSDGTCPVPFG